jgi:hypothetical protein
MRPRQQISTCIGKRALTRIWAICHATEWPILPTGCYLVLYHGLDDLTYPFS